MSYVSISSQVADLNKKVEELLAAFESIIHEDSFPGDVVSPKEAAKTAQSMRCLIKAEGFSQGLFENLEKSIFIMSGSAKH